MKGKNSRKEYFKRYYEQKRKYLHPNKWTMSKSKWVKCPFCNSNHWYNPMRLYEPEVFAMNYGGRGCIEKYPESKMVADGLGVIIRGVKANYMRDLKNMAAKFLRLYCSEDELKQLFSDILVQVNTSSPMGFHTPISSYVKSSIPSSLSDMRVGYYKKPITTVKSKSEGVKTVWEN